MFTISFRDGSDGEKVWGARPDYNEEHLISGCYEFRYDGKIGESFMDFVSLSGDIANSEHPYLRVLDEAPDTISEHFGFFAHLREYLDLGIDNPAFLSLPCLMFFADLTGTSIPAMHYVLQRKAEFDDETTNRVCIEDNLPQIEECSPFQKSMRAYLSFGKEYYDVPQTEYDCETIEDACIASLHFLIVHQFTIRKCKNCGKYFIAYNRSDTDYCDRPSPYNPKYICKEDGARRKHKDTTNNDKALKLYKETDAARRMRTRRHPENKDMAAEFIEWKEAALKMKADYSSGRISATEFINWLNHNKRYEPFRRY